MLDKLSTKQLYLYTTLGAIFANLLWGTAFPVLKIVYAEMHITSSAFGDTLAFISLRFLLAGLAIIAFACYRKQKLFALSYKQWGLIAVLGIFNTTIQYFFFNIGVNNTSGIKAAILGQIGIFFSIILAHFVYKNDKLTFRKVLGLVFGFIGLIIVNLGKSSEGIFSFTLVGEGFMILSGLTSALSIFIAKRAGKEIPTLVYTGWQMVIGSILLLVLGTLAGGNVFELTFTPLSTVLLLYLALLSSVAFVIWYSILQYRKIGEISLYKFVVPVSGTVLTALFIPGEHLTAAHIAGLLLVSVGIIVVNRKRPTK